MNQISFDLGFDWNLGVYDVSIIEELPFILLNYSEQIALYIIIDFNSMALFFAYKLFYNKKNNNAKIRIMNGFVAV